MRTWTHFVAIDWSGASTARQVGIAIAICSPGDGAPELVRPGHRWSRKEVLRWLIDDMPDGTLAGFDASPAFAFADKGAYFPGWAESPSDARLLWAMVDRMCERDMHMGTASFVDHDEASRHFRRQGKPIGDLFEGSRGRLRETEQRQAKQKLNPSSCFNLVGAAQVGKSSLTIMRLLHRLQRRIPVWPFDDVPSTGSLLVEIYTTIAARAAGLAPGRSKMDAAALDAALAHPHITSTPVRAAALNDHEADALLTAAWLRRASSDPALWHPGTPFAPEIAQTEGWTFGVA